MKANNNKGTAIVEFAIVLPLLFLLLMGIIEFSLVLYDKAVLTNASREGARAGIVVPKNPPRDPLVDDPTIKGIVKNYCSTFLISFPPRILQDADIAISRSGLSFGDDLTVTVNYRYDFLVLPSFMTTALGPINLVAQTVMRLE